MSTPPTGNLVKWWPAVSDEPTPSETALHTRLLFNAANDHDQAITLLKQQLNNAGATATSVLEEIAAAVSSSGVTSFNTHIGNVTFFPQLGMVNDQLGQPTYLTQMTDNGVKIIVGDSVPVAITLNAGVSIPWFCIIDNDSSAVANLTPSSGALYGESSIPSDGFGIVFYDGTNFWCGATGGASTPPTAYRWSNIFLGG